MRMEKKFNNEKRQQDRWDDAHQANSDLVVMEERRATDARGGDVRRAASGAC